MPLAARVRLYTRGMALLALAACAHSEPFQDPNETQTGPFSPALPVQLTYNIGIDATPVFLPGDSLLLYSFNRPGGTMRDQCLAALPTAGGTDVNESCPISASSIDSVEQYLEPAVIDDISIAYVQDLLQINGRGHHIYIGTAPWRSAFQFTPLLSFPYPSSDPTAPIIMPSYLFLPGNDQVAFVANETVLACPGVTIDCDPQVVPLGFSVSQVPLTTPNAVPVVLSGTDTVTAAGTGRTPGSVIFTRRFDTKVYERSASGSIVPLFDFGPASVSARDPVVSGNRLVAVIGGVVEIWGAKWDSLGNATVLLQVDSGGDLGVADLSNGTYQTITGNGLFYRRPSLSRDGARILAQGVTRGAPNIYLVTVP